MISRPHFFLLMAGVHLTACDVSSSTGQWPYRYVDVPKFGFDAKGLDCESPKPADIDAVTTLNAIREEAHLCGDIEFPKADELILMPYAECAASFLAKITAGDGQIRLLYLLWYELVDSILERGSGLRGTDGDVEALVPLWMSNPDVCALISDPTHRFVGVASYEVDENEDAGQPIRVVYIYFTSHDQPWVY